jgi:hypothetical protein
MFDLHQRLQILVADRFDNIPPIVEHLDFRPPITGALPCLAER